MLNLKLLRYRLIGLVASFLIFGLANAIAQVQAPNSKLKRVLLLDKSQGGTNGHLESRRDLVLSLKALATNYGFSLDIIGQSDNVTASFQAIKLANYQVVIFSNNDGVDKQIGGSLRTNFEAYIQNGGGFIAVHADSAFISSWPFMDTILVERFYGPHGANQPTADLTHDSEALKDDTETKGIFKDLTAPLAFLDSYYSFLHTPRGEPGVTVLLTVDEKTFSKTVYGPMGADHPIVWVKTVGKGRVVNNSLGHSWTVNVYTQKDHYLHNLLYGMLRYAAGDFVGCTDNRFKEFNPDASKSNVSACVTPLLVRVAFNKDSKQSVLPLVSQNENGSLVNVEFFSKGTRELSISDISGKLVYSNKGSGQIRFSIPTPKKSGIYIVKAKADGKITNQRVTVL